MDTDTLVELLPDQDLRLLCDEMLRGLGRWLRAAGYDTVVAEGAADDRDLAARARREGRVLITRDRHLAAFAATGARVALLRADGLDEQAREARERLGVDWLAAPFTRCMVDNAPLRPAWAHQAAQVPPQSRTADGAVRACPACGRVYWPGGHVRRMLAQLAAWKGAGSTPAPDGPTP